MKKEKQEILQWIKEEKSKAWICQQLQCKQITLNGYLKKWNIEYHGQQQFVNNSDFNYVPLEEYLKGDSERKSTIILKKLIKEKYKEDKCEICGISFWQNVKIPLELHHKDGNHYNNTLENFQILCPNCHSIQDGHRGRKKSLLNTEKFEEENPKDKNNHCIDCGTLIWRGSVRCKACESERRIKENKEKNNRPSREELKKLIRSMPFTTIGTKYGVTDNAIRKWCDSEELPRTKKEINSFSDEDWERI